MKKWISKAVVILGLIMLSSPPLAFIIFFRNWPNSQLAGMIGVWVNKIGSEDALRIFALTTMVYVGLILAITKLVLRKLEGRSNDEWVRMKALLKLILKKLKRSDLDS